MLELVAAYAVQALKVADKAIREMKPNTVEEGLGYEMAVAIVCSEMDKITAKFPRSTNHR